MESGRPGLHLISDQFEPPRYRIHVVLDADAAARRDLRQAMICIIAGADGSLLD
jgi:hypothetical protein